MYPISSLSYSRLRLYLTSKVMFWRQYVTKDYEAPRTATMVEGSVIHRLMEACLNHSLVNTGGIQLCQMEDWDGQALLEEYIRDEYPTITYQGSTKITPALLEKHATYVMGEWVPAMNMYLAESSYRRFTGAEVPMKAFIKDASGISFQIPFVGRIDALSIDFEDGEETVTIHDWKVVRSTSQDSIDRTRFMYQFQQIPYFLMARELYPRKKIRVVYHLCKVSEPRKKTDDPVIAHVVMEPPTDADVDAFCLLLDMMLRDLKGLPAPGGMPYLMPNVFDDTKGKRNWELFTTTYASTL